MSVATTASLLLTRDSPDSLVAGVVISVLISFVIYNFAEHQRARAAVADHVVEASRDVAVPDHCAGCGVPHATIALDFTSLMFGASPIVQALSRLKRKYRFRLCRACARPVLRRRRIGHALMVAGGVLMAVAGLFFIMPPTRFGFTFETMLPFLNVLLFVLMTGGVVFVAGLLINVRAGSNIVSILDTRGETVLFRFGNQVYRNHFAELNGVR